MWRPSRSRDLGLQMKHLIPPAPSIFLAGQQLQAVPGNISSLAALHGWQRLRECGSDKQGCLKPGFPGHILSTPPPAFTEAELGNKARFLPFAGLCLAQEQACRNPCSWQGLGSGWDSTNRLGMGKPSLRGELSLCPAMPQAGIWI